MLSKRWEPRAHSQRFKKISVSWYRIEQSSDNCVISLPGCIHLNDFYFRLPDLSLWSVSVSIAESAKAVIKERDDSLARELFLVSANSNWRRRSIVSVDAQVYPANVL